MSYYKKMNLATKTMLAMVLGAIAGFIIGENAVKIQFIGTVWLNMIKMFLVPTVVCMLVRGISSMDSPKTLGRIGAKVIAFYLVTTVFAAIIGIVIGDVFKPGIGNCFYAGRTQDTCAELVFIHVRADNVHYWNIHEICTDWCILLDGSCHGNIRDQFYWKYV